MSDPKAKPVTTLAAEATARKDPNPRHTEWLPNGADISGHDPAKKYVWVNLGAEFMGVGFYENLGYEREVAEEGGVRPAAGRAGKPGDHIELAGHVLMSIPKEQANKIRIHGAPGAGNGLKANVERDKHNLARTRADLLRRAAGGDYMHVETHLNRDVKTNTL